MHLIHTIDGISQKSDKYVEHGTAISKLLSRAQATKLREMERELAEAEENVG